MSDPVIIDDTLDPGATEAAALAEAQREWDDFRRRVIREKLGFNDLSDGVEKVYSTSEVAKFFNKSYQWVYWGLHPDPETGRQVFSYRDGTPIRPERVGRIGKRRFTLPIIREIAKCCFRRGNLTEEGLEAIMAKVLLAEFGENAFADD